MLLGSIQTQSYVPTHRIAMFHSELTESPADPRRTPNPRPESDANEELQVAVDGL